MKRKLFTIVLIAVMLAQIVVFSVSAEVPQGEKFVLSGTSFSDGEVIFEFSDVVSETQPKDAVLFLHDGNTYILPVMMSKNIIAAELPDSFKTSDKSGTIRLSENISDSLGNTIGTAKIFGVNPASLIYQNDFEPDPEGNYERFYWKSTESWNADYGLIGKGGYFADSGRTGQLIKDHALVLSNPFFLLQTSPLYLKSNVDQPNGTSHMTTTNKYYSEKATDVSVDFVVMQTKSNEGNSVVQGGVATRVYLTGRSASDSFRLNRQGSAYMAYLSYDPTDSKNYFSLVRYDDYGAASVTGSGVTTVFSKQEVTGVALNDEYHVSISAQTLSDGSVSLTAGLAKKNGNKIILVGNDAGADKILGGTFGVVATGGEGNAVIMRYDNWKVNESCTVTEISDVMGQYGFSYTTTANKANGSIGIVNIGSEKKTVDLVFGAYSSNNELLGVQIIPSVSVLAGASIEQPFEIEYSGELNTITAFVWDLETLYPFCGAMHKDNG